MFKVTRDNIYSCSVGKRLRVMSHVRFARFLPDKLNVFIVLHFHGQIITCCNCV